MNQRIIGIRHRVKRTADNEARPTQLCVVDEAGGQPVHIDLETETDELDWLLGRLPESWRLAKKDEDVSKLPVRHIRQRKVKKSEDLAKLQAECLVKEDAKGNFFVVEVPEVYTGMKPGDTIAMILGGSGDRFAFALSRRAEELGGNARVLRIQPAKMKDWRENYFAAKIEDDAQTLALLVGEAESEFTVTTRRDRDLIRLTEAWRARVDAMKARMAAEQRLRAHLIGAIFCNESGKYPEGGIELLYEERRTNDQILQSLYAEENARNKELARAVESLDVFQEIFLPVKGIGPMIATRLIVAIGDIRRFATDAKLKAFIGAHVLNGGKHGERTPDKQFPRRRSGELANWHPDGRQALYLVLDQFNRNPLSEWGLKLREYKVKFRTKHPDIMCSCGKPKAECDGKSPGSGKHFALYTDGHIHKMAMWRTATKFVEWLWRAWWQLEKRTAAK